MYSKLSKILFPVFILFFSFFTSCQHESDSIYGLVIHGGAGTMSKENLTPEIRKLYQDKLNEALDIGMEILQKGGSSIDAIEKTINVMENSPLFNSGKGAVFTHEGHNELDASIMEGKTLNAGAVAGVGDVKNPISLARIIMENSNHVLLSGKGASEFARKEGLEMVDSSYFYTDRRWKALQKALKNKKFGTVGCVALDKDGNLAAGTSTGGMTNKRYGRIGDSPIIGAGTYANNNSCAISCTGHGEFFIRYTVAADVAARMRYKKITLNQAADEIINHELKDINASGGLIAVDKNGNIAMTFNTSGMFRAYAKEGEKGKVLIFKN